MVILGIRNTRLVTISIVPSVNLVVLIGIERRSEGGIMNNGKKTCFVCNRKKKDIHPDHPCNKIVCTTCYNDMLNNCGLSPELQVHIMIESGHKSTPDKSKIASRYKGKGQ